MALRTRNLVRWLIHEAFAQAVEQLFAEEYLGTSSEKVNVRICEILQWLNEEVKEYVNSTQSSYEKSQQGEFA